MEVVGRKLNVPPGRVVPGYYSLEGPPSRERTPAKNGRSFLERVQQKSTLKRKSKGIEGDESRSPPVDGEEEYLESDYDSRSSEGKRKKADPVRIANFKSRVDLRRDVLGVVEDADSISKANHKKRKRRLTRQQELELARLYKPRTNEIMKMNHFDVGMAVKGGIID